MKIFKILGSCLVLSAVFFASCEDYFAPSPNNQYDESRVYEQARFAEGLLLNAFSGLPTVYAYDEAATDDAVTNVNGRNYKRMATGEWSSQFDPQSAWTSAYSKIYYLNYFLSVVDSVNWSWENPVRKALFAKRFKGEAYGLRAWYYLNLLQKHGGKGADGNMLGFIILDKYIQPEEMDPNMPRSSFEDCVDFIEADCDSAIKLLPLDYADIPNETDYNMVFGGIYNKNRVSGRYAMAIKSRLLLHAASPAYNETPSQVMWEKAAIAAGDLLETINGVAGLSASGLKWYLNENDADIIWRKDYFTGLSWETQNFPPSLFGNGRDNPTQNFVDAFPMLNGLPIGAPGSGYQETDPYTNRDPRLAAYVVVNGSKIGTTTINTHVGDLTNGIGNTLKSTLTGYYSRKLMNEAVKLGTPTNSAVHFYTLFRYTEIFLNYAEAANEAWGPDGDPEGYGFTPRSIIQAIRSRAGITPQPDAYITTITAADKDLMRSLIRNERRIELSFEGFRFWDMRRWDLDLTETAKGMRIEGTTYTPINVEERNYLPYMKYGPLPYRETLNNKNLIQNEGY